jgi:gluconate 2-dehydrogenase gamma chain
MTDNRFPPSSTPSTKSLNRRDFVRRGGLYGAGILIGLNTPRPLAAAAAEKSEVPLVLSPDEWKSVEAITARIIPTDHEGGAREANCVNFIDKALANEDAVAVPLYKGGLAALDGVAQHRFGKRFVEVEPAKQDEILSALERGDAKGWALSKELPSPPFFETLRLHTLVGFLADPAYGGNRDFTGWRVAGYPGPRHRRGGFAPDQVEGKAPIVPVWERKS